VSPHLWRLFAALILILSIAFLLALFTDGSNSGRV
jgi:hypothetical protein